MIGGLIFTFYIAGYLVFSALSSFSMQNRLINKMYYRVVEPTEMKEGGESEDMNDDQILEKAVREVQRREKIQTDKASFMGCCFFRKNFHSDDVKKG